MTTLRVLRTDHRTGGRVTLPEGRASRWIAIAMSGTPEPEPESHRAARTEAVEALRSGFMCRTPFATCRVARGKR